MYKNFVVVMVGVLFFICSGLAEIAADEFTIINESEILYGKGVHAFFDGNYKEAIEIFNKVEYLASEDPRPYFFAAIARYRLDADSADADKYFKKAAKLELEGRSFREYDVSDALRRIQGKERLHVERYRTQTKIEWQKTNSVRDNIRYGQQVEKDKKIVAGVSKSFVGTAEFGASSPDPFKNDKNNTENKSSALLNTIIDSANATGGEAKEVVDVSIPKKPDGYDKTPLEGVVQVEGQMIIDDEDVFAEFDDEPKQVAETKSTDESESPKETITTPNDTEKTETETTETTDPKPADKPETTTEPEPDKPESIVDPEPEKKPESTTEPEPDKPESIVDPEPEKKPESN
ncbi:MAG: hypothetical protein LBT09_10280 [Planctomycetaceae bacterium]|jgi:hypothetical protein|nr:hypothetical protein [Planctomycetaceae bacterium]